VLINQYKSFRIVLSFFLLSSLSYTLEIRDLAHAVDVSGKQRMFTQRMLKDYAMVGLENNFGNPRKTLRR